MGERGSRWATLGTRLSLAFRRIAYLHSIRQSRCLMQLALKFCWTRRTPKQVLDAHAPEQHAQLDLDLWSPTPSARLPMPITAKAGLMPTHKGVGPDDCEDLKDRPEPTIKLNEEPAIVVRKLGPAPHLAAQDDQLISKRRILRLRSALRLECRDQDG